MLYIRFCNFNRLKALKTLKFGIVRRYWVIQKYSKGRRLEYQAMYILRKEGYYCFRSAGSKGILDIIAIPNLTLAKEGKRPFGLQVKSGIISKAEKNKIANTDIAILKQIWIKPDYKNWIIYVYDDINCEWKKIV